MTPTWDLGDQAAYQGDSLDILRQIPEESVDCIVTSPPYWGLRDYGHSGQIGLEESPDEWVARLVAVFAECRRVLAPHGTCWVNIGDAYASKARGSDAGWDKSRLSTPGHVQKAQAQSLRVAGGRHRGQNTGLKEKDLIGLPWLLAFALRTDGWWLRSEIIWAKPNPMPESVRDRPTKAHEQVFLLTRQPRYWYDAEAIREDSIGQNLHDLTGPGYGAPGQTPQTGTRRSKQPDGWATHEGGHGSYHRDGRENGEASVIRTGRNARSVWTIATQPSPIEHYATFPQELARRCIAAGCPERVCRTCGKPSERIVETSYENPGNRTTNGPRSIAQRHETAGFTQRLERRDTTVGWTDCGHDDWRQGVVLDPFLGSGTTLQVARRLNRHGIGIELNAEYLDLAHRRVETEPRPQGTQLALDGGA